MSNLLQMVEGSKSYGVRSLFNNAGFAINEEEHVGVIGPNGAGKTTLFKILTGSETLDDGSVVKSKNLRLGYLAQHDVWSPEETIESYLSNGCVTPIWTLKSLGEGLGLTQDLFQKPIASMSGGYRMRCKLLYLIGQEPNLMLLDEPTNYLDLETTLVLENFLQGYKGAFLLISHDREFLRRTTDHILEIEQGDITKYNGNIDDYFEQKTLLRTQLEARATSLEEKRNNVLAFVARFGAKASKAKQAQSRLKSLDRMETIELKNLPVSAIIRIPPPLRAGKIIVSLDNVDLGYGNKVVLSQVTLDLLNGDHLAVVGLNGSGKSTLLKSLAQKLRPLRGEILLGHEVKIGYYAQHVAEDLESNQTVLESMISIAHPSVTMQDGLNMAGSLLFSGDDMNKKISVLSGGEKSRVALGKILLQKAPCLILDEPTNHLDFQTVEALTQALNSYEGTVVIVSHDRSFVRRVGRKILEINDGRALMYPGTYDEYVWSLERGILSSRSQTASSQNLEPRIPEVPLQPSKLSRDARKELLRELRQHEKSIAHLEEKMGLLQSQLIELNTKITESPSDALGSLVKDFGELQRKLELAENNWLTTVQKKEQIEKSIQIQD